MFVLAVTVGYTIGLVGPWHPFIYRLVAMPMCANSQSILSNTYGSIISYNHRQPAKSKPHFTEKTCDPHGSMSQTNRIVHSSTYIRGFNGLLIMRKLLEMIANHWNSFQALFRSSARLGMCNPFILNHHLFILYIIYERQIAC